MYRFFCFLYIRNKSIFIMKKILALFGFLFFAFTSCAQDHKTVEVEEISTYYLIRHAEKDRSNSSNRNPDLSEIGVERAKKWSEVMSHIDFDAVYSTKYNRTMQTATPTAERNNLDIQSYDPRKMYDAKFQKETKGQTVLIVGHSNTTPFFVNKILKEEKFDEMDDDNNSNLYIVTVTKDARTCVLLRID